MTKIVRFALFLASLLVAFPAFALTGPILHFYDAQSGRTGCLEIRPTLSPLLKPVGHDSISAGWTHVVHMPDTNLIFYYNANTGSGAVAFNSGNCVYATPHSFSAGHFSQGWTSVAPAGGPRLLFYRASDGLTALATVASDGGVSTLRSPVLPPSTSILIHTVYFPAGYTSVVKVGNGMFFYNGVTGDGEYGTFDTEGWYHRVSMMPAKFSPGWTHIVYIPASDRILYYNRSSGNAALGQIDNSGNHTTLRSFAWGTPGFSQIVPTSGTTLLFYNSADGTTTLGAVSDAGFGQIFSSQSVAGTGWSSVVFGS